MNKEIIGLICAILALVISAYTFGKGKSCERNFMFDNGQQACVFSK